MKRRRSTDGTGEVSCWDCVHHYFGGSIIMGSCGCEIDSSNHPVPNEDYDWDDLDDSPCCHVHCEDFQRVSPCNRK